MANPFQVFLAALGLWGLIALPVRAQIVVEASRLSEESVLPSSSVHVLTQKQIQQKGNVTLGELLEDEPGVNVFSSGGAGQVTSVYLRGAAADQTLVLIDGIEVNDPMNTDRRFDFSTLSSENIERIEIYLGPQAVRFGAGATGGVINVITKKGKGPLQGAYGLETGSYQTNKAAISVSGSKGFLGYSAGVSSMSAQGFSAADQKYGNTEDDGMNRLSLSSRLDFEISKKTSLTATARATQGKTELDAFGGPRGDDPDDAVFARSQIWGLTARSKFFKNHLSSSLGVFQNNAQRFYDNHPDALQTADSHEKYTSSQTGVRFQNSYVLSEASTLDFGGDWHEESGGQDGFIDGAVSSQPEHRSLWGGGYLLYEYEDDHWLLNAGGRSDGGSQIGSIWSSNVDLSYLVSPLKTWFGASYGNGYKRPSLYQLYSNYGNPELRVENEDAVSVFARATPTKAAAVSLSLFKNSFRDRIDYKLNKYYNVGRASSEGVELDYDQKWTARVATKLTETVLRTRDEDTGESLFHQPAQSFAAKVIWTDHPWKTLLNFRWVGARADEDPVSFQRISLAGYETVDVALTYTFCKELQWQGRIENLFDQHYEEMAGYGTSGVAFYTGLSGEF